MSVVEAQRPDPAPAPARVSSSIGRHSPALDGIRAVGMLWMLGYHGELPWTAGAFLALSQFFTLSGFLISGVLLRNHLVPGGSLRGFWERRARRLMPAAFIALAGIAVFGATVATKQQAQGLPGQVAAAATWTANWQFVLTHQSYVNLFAAPSPVQHFWSLAIEEQFYVLLPIGLFFLVRRTRSPLVIGGMLGGLALLSTAWMAFLYGHGASLDRIYYGTDTRVSELLVGATLGVVVWHTGLDFSERMRQVLAVAGVVAYAATIWCFVNVPLADGPIWRGGFLLFSLMTCVVILSALAGRGPLVAFLAWGPLPAIGRLTYGLYIYHWPIFLWLTEDRTGLSRWPLFVVRTALTFVVAILSYNLVERPIMRGATLGIRGRARFALAPVVAIVVVAGTFAIVNRSAPDPLATLNAQRASAAMPRVAGDGVLDLLVIPPRANDPVIARLQADVKNDKSVKLTMAPPFRCAGGLVAVSDPKIKDAQTCANWAETWPALIKTYNPDVVLLYADDWAGQRLGVVTHTTSPNDLIGAAQRVLAPAIDILTARGAPVVFSNSGLDFAHAIRRALLPFNQAMGRLRAVRTDVFDVISLPDPTTVSHADYLAKSATTLLTDAALYQREGASTLPKVMIVGDSQALSLGYGLDQWTAQHKRALVWDHGVEGCGVAVDGDTRSFGSTDSGIQRCRDAVNAWPTQLASFRPKVVVVFSSLTDIQDRKLPGASKYSSIGEPAFDAYLVKEYEHVIDTLSATGARVVWMIPPCTAVKAVPGQAPPYSSAHVQHLDTVILAKVFRDRPKVVPFDLAGVICPDGKPLKSVSGVGTLRPDGIHFSVNGALWFAQNYGEKLLKAGGI